MTAVLLASVFASAGCARPDPVRIARSDTTPSATPTLAPTRSPIVSPPASPPPSPVVPLRETRARPAPAGTSSDDAIAREILRVFGPVHGPEALGVFDCESGDHDGRAPYTFDAKQISPTNDYGVAQLNRRYQEARANRLGYSWDRMLEVTPNLLVAKDLFDEKGWGPWVCRWAA